ncbi:MAG: amidohydrolase family protein, partial [Aureispira sp.]|nr:amidohydrolase family protein [Aureispira sp.]
LMLKLAEEYNHPTHIVHLSSIDCLDEIRAAKKRGVPITVETCPHYLYFNAETIPNAQTRYKCAPPIREQANNAVLWAALIDGTLDFIGSDHSPAPPEIKELDSGNFQKAWGGISGIQFTLPAIWTLGRTGNLSLNRLATVLCEAPAKFIGLENQKGKIAKGFDADFVVWDKEEAYTVSLADIEARHKVSPYEGETLYGTVKRTFVGGWLTWNEGKVVHAKKGKTLLSK